MSRKDEEDWFWKLKLYLGKLIFFGALTEAQYWRLSLLKKGALWLVERESDPTWASHLFIPSFTQHTHIYYTTHVITSKEKNEKNLQKFQSTRSVVVKRKKNKSILAFIFFGAIFRHVVCYFFFNKDLITTVTPLVLEKIVWTDKMKFPTHFFFLCKRSTSWV